MTGMKKVLALSLSLTALAQAGGAGPAADPLQPLLDFARKHPQQLALQVAEVNSDGSLNPVLTWNANETMPLASTRKIVVLAAYAQAVAKGKLNPQTPVKLGDWEKYYLPQLDGGAHASSLKALGLQADQLGRATQPEKTVPLDTLARFMIEASDNAATDYLMVLLGQDALQSQVPRFGLTGQETLSPLSGWMANLVLTPGYDCLPLPERVSQNWAMAQQLRGHPELQLKVLEAAGKLSPTELSARLERTDTRGTVRDYNQVMAVVLSGQGMRPGELVVMRRHLGWPARVFPEMGKAFSALYAKGGSLPGILTNNYAFTPQVGPYKDRSFVVSTFLHQIHDKDYKALNTVLAGDGLLRLSLDPASQQKLAKALKP